MQLEKNLNKIVSVLLILSFAFIVILGVLALFGIEMKGTFNSSNMILPVISICLNLIVIKLIIYSLRLGKIVFDKFEKIIILSTIAFVFLISVFIIFSNHHAYYWDEAENYMRYFEIEDWFNNGTINGMRSMLISVRSEFKGTLSTLFVTVPFLFTNKTENSWCISIFFNMIPALVVVYAALLKRIQRILDIAGNKKFFGLNVVLIFSVPLMYIFTNGFLEQMGLIFSLILCSVLLDTSFEKNEYSKWIIIGVSAILAVMSSDIYIIWCISFAVSYLLVEFTKIAVKKDYDKLKKWGLHVLSFGICFVGIAIVFLFPFVKSFLFSESEGKDNNFWVVGGYTFAIKGQINYLGLWLVILMLSGIIGGLICRKCRALTSLTILHGVITLLVFQQMVTLVAPEHSMVMVPFYILSVAIGVYFVINIKKELLASVIYKLLILFGAVNLLFSICGGRYFVRVFTNLSLRKSEDQVKEIKEVADWVSANCEDGETAYFIPHGQPYNPDKFRFINMPDRTMLNIMPYGSAVLGYHAFPVYLFDSKYVLTSMPFCEYSVAEKYNDAFLGYLEIDAKFELVNEFDMGDGYIISVYERMKPVDMDEITYYMTFFEEENVQYPALYGDIFDKYIDEHSIELQQIKE